MKSFPTEVDKALADLKEDRWRENETVRQAKVLNFVRNHPDCTADDVFKATGFGVIGIKFLYFKRDKNGVPRWRLNELRWNRWVRTGKK